MNKNKTTNLNNTNTKRNPDWQKIYNLWCQVLESRHKESKEDGDTDEQR